MPAHEITLQQKDMLGRRIDATSPEGDQCMLTLRALVSHELSLMLHKNLSCCSPR